MRTLEIVLIGADDAEAVRLQEEYANLRVVPALDDDGEPRFGGVDAVVVRLAPTTDERGLLEIARASRDYPAIPLLALVPPEAEEFGPALVRAGADAYHVSGRHGLVTALRSLVARARREAKELREAERTFTLCLDGDNVVRRCEGMVQEILGRSPDELVGLPLRDLVPPDAVPLATVTVEQVRNRDSVSAPIQVRAWHRSGRAIRLEGVASEEGEEGQVRVNLRDISAEWTAAQALRESEKRFESFLDAAPIAIAVADATGQLAVTNSAFQRMLGYDAEELRARSVADLTHPEDMAKDEGLFREVLAGVRDSYQIEKRYIRKDGSVLRGRLTTFVERDEAGRPAVGYGMMEDITEKRALEDQLRQSQKLEALGRLAGGVAHDFNNILTSIRGSAALLLEDLPQESSFRAEAEEIRASSERAAHLTRQLLTFSRKAVGSDELLDPEQLISGMDRMLQRLIPATITLRTEFAEETPLIRLDRTHFEQVLVNLVVNAADAVGEGGVIEVITESVPARSQDDPASGFTRLTVRDNGVGMDEVVQSSIFEPFFTTKEPGKGTGLGLSTVYGLVTRVGGRITVDSTPGVGTAFHVDFPVAEEGAASDDQAAGPSQTMERGSGTVLIVEDSRAVLRLVHRVLSRTGYEVLTAASADEALTLLDQPGRDRLDLLLTDVVMPGMRGQDLAHGVRERYPDAQIVFMSGYDSDDVIGRETQNGDARFLPKPFTPDELRTMIREALASTAADG